MEIPRVNRESQRRLVLDKGFRDAVAEHLQRRWPSGTAKFAARTYDITLDRAREAVLGRCSLTTLEAICKRGGWPVGLELLAAVIGYGIENHIAQMREAHEARGKRLAALFGMDRGPAALPDHGHSSVHRGPDRRRASDRL